jgi:hypothetical protein
MSPRLDASPPKSEPEADVTELDLGTDRRATCDSTEATSTEHTRPALRDVAVVGGLFVAYVVALTAIGVFRVVRWPFQHARTS